MKIVADENIVHVEHWFGRENTLVTKPGRSIVQHDLQDADMLLVRSVTKVDAALLKGSAVKFVGSCTTGTDHLDIPWLEKNGIQWAVAAGCNTRAVVEYLTCTLAAIQKSGFLQGPSFRAAIVGAGRIGKAVAHMLELAGFSVTCCDPFLPEISPIGFDDIADFDLISFHTPLTTDGPHPTFHLVEKKFLLRQKKDCILINTSRGAVVHSEDLKKAGRHLLWCLDVFEHEPWPDFRIIEAALLATPHIAGYTTNAKIVATEMIYHAARESGLIAETALPLQKLHAASAVHFTPACTDWRDAVLEIFNPRTVSAQMKSVLKSNPAHFDPLRKKFSARLEFSEIKTLPPTLDQKNRDLLQQLGVGGAAPAQSL